jgi:hypothetical protein
LGFENRLKKKLSSAAEVARETHYAAEDTS